MDQQLLLETNTNTNSNNFDNCKEVINDYITDLFRILTGAESTKFISENPSIKQFFANIKFDIYLISYIERIYYMTGIIRSLITNIDNVVPVRERFVHRLTKRNSKCFERALTFRRLATEARETFNQSKAKYLENNDSPDQKSVRSWFKKGLGIGRLARYKKMTSGILECLYETIFKFSEKILEREQSLNEQQCAFPNVTDRFNYIQKLRENSTPDQISDSVMVKQEIDAINACLINFKEDKLKELLDKSLQELSPNVSQEETRDNSSETESYRPSSSTDVPSESQQSSELQRSSVSQRPSVSQPLLSVSTAGSRRYTHRRRHSKHSHKSIKRYKKGKKIMKSHKKKRHTHIRKQNKRKI
jgi:hypothetical protein